MNIGDEVKSVRLIASSPQAWQEFAAFFDRQIPIPKQAILAAAIRGGREVVIAGVAVFETEGPYVLFEHFGTNQHVPQVLRHAGAVAVANGIKGYLTVRGRVAMMLVTPKGAVKMLVDRGAAVVEDATVMLWVPPLLGTRVVPPAKKPPEPRRRRVVRDTEPARPPPKEKPDETDEDFFERSLPETEDPADLED